MHVSMGWQQTLKRENEMLRAKVDKSDKDQHDFVSYFQVRHVMPQGATCMYTYHKLVWHSLYRPQDRCRIRPGAGDLHSVHREGSH
jgi:hypothetical protein